MAKRSQIDFGKLEWHSLSLKQRQAIVREHGLSALNTWDETFLGATAWGLPSASNLAFAKWLVAEGHPIDAHEKRGETPLHLAAQRGNLPMVQWMLASGVKVDLKNREAQSPLEHMLKRATNAELPEVRDVLKALLKAKAKVTPAARASAERLYKEMDYYKDAMLPAFRKKCEAAATEICALVGATPPAARVRHDGKSPITLVSGGLEKQWAALWNSLVPPQGPAKTLQGETVRVAGRINDELHRNGGVNWDRAYQQMARAFTQYVRMGNALDAKSLAKVDAVIAKLTRNSDGSRTLTAAAVEWVKRNPKPVKAPKPAYRR